VLHITGQSCRSTFASDPEQFAVVKPTHASASSHGTAATDLKAAVDNKIASASGAVLDIVPLDLRTPF
jgi:hypothetical protein